MFAHSESNAGNLLSDVHEGLIGDTDMRFSTDMPFDAIDVLFLCFGHGKSEEFLRQNSVPDNIRIIDLAQDFRISSPGHDFVYGLPEIHRRQISTALHVANPGCFATAIQLGLLPLAKAGMLKHDISVNAITGSTGAGQKPAATTHFSWRNGNISIYKVFTHQHLAEIRQSLSEMQGLFDASLDFIPYRGDFARGIFCTSVVTLDETDSNADFAGIYKEFYKDSPFTHYTERALDLKQVVGTNKCLLHIDQFGRKLVITSVIDNLLKGAVGQAVENMNIMCGIPEDTGLRLKAIAF